MFPLGMVQLLIQQNTNFEYKFYINGLCWVLRIHVQNTFYTKLEFVAWQLFSQVTEQGKGLLNHLLLLNEWYELVEILCLVGSRPSLLRRRKLDLFFWMYLISLTLCFFSFCMWILSSLKYLFEMNFYMNKPHLIHPC